MKRLLCLLLALSALLCGCQTQIVPADTEAPVTLPAEPQSTKPTEPVWTGFTGSMEGYVYLHDKERDKKWEEDILLIAQDFLDNHPWLVDDTTMTFEVESYISTPNWEWKSQYIPEKRDAFLAEVNALLPLIPEFNDERIVWEIQRILSTVGECHANLMIDSADTFHMYYYPFMEEDGLSIRAVTVPEDKPHLLYAELTAINGIPVTEILEKIRPYSSTTTESGFINNSVLRSTMFSPSLLRTVGVMEPDATSAEFTFLTESGETVTEIREARHYNDYADEPTLDHFYKFQLPYAFSDQKEKAYWIDHWEEMSTLYIRLSSYNQNEDETYLETNREIYAVLQSVETLDKIILDLRQNGGGSPPSALAGLLNFLKNPKVQQVYVLIDGGCYSMTVIGSYNIRTEIPDAIFVGSPTGQGLPTGSVRDKITTPNHGLIFRTPGGMSVLESGESFEYFEPDILLYQTLDDYKQEIDTVLKYVTDLD